MLKRTHDQISNDDGDDGDGAMQGWIARKRKFQHFSGATNIPKILDCLGSDSPADRLDVACCLGSEFPHMLPNDDALKLAKTEAMKRGNHNGDVLVQRLDRLQLYNRLQQHTTTMRSATQLETFVRENGHRFPHREWHQGLGNCFRCEDAVERIDTLLKEEAAKANDPNMMAGGHDDLFGTYKSLAEILLTNYVRTDVIRKEHHRRGLLRLLCDDRFTSDVSDDQRRELWSATLFNVRVPEPIEYRHLLQSFEPTIQVGEEIMTTANKLC